ncbi:enoyl-CoA hydratase/isomerase family protein [Actinomycetospora sp. OC33-EN08]|uniref:Enoyl-CoA hydratase/isomerase family protein n=1 Tax=Actinomycetospora aurantiaca TaxID=3129233 RepID=A0ABU8MHS9_9PSEU
MTAPVLTRDDGPAVHVTIDRPEARNALSPAVLAGLRDALDHAEEAGAGIVVLRGTGGTLSAGADLHHVRRMLADGARDELGAYLVDIGAVCDRLESGPWVSVAVVEGYALAGGCELLLACDLSVVTEDALVGDRHLEHGLLPGAGGSVRLPRALPAPLARRLLYTGEMIDGATAGAWGLVSHTAAPGGSEEVLAALVARLARHGPDALARMKQRYRAAAPAADPGLLAAERAALLEHLTTSRTVTDGLAAFARRTRNPQEAP